MGKGDEESRGRLDVVVSRMIFIGYLVAVVYIMFFAENFGRTSFSRGYRYNVSPFTEIRRFYSLILRDIFNYKAWLNLAGNVAAFIPFGIFFPMIRIRSTGMTNTVIAAFAFSMLIETIQLVTRLGVFDVDDLILNTLGGLFGYLLYAAGKSKRRRKDNEA